MGNVYCCDQGTHFSGFLICHYYNTKYQSKPLITLNATRVTTLWLKQLTPIQMSEGLVRPLAVVVRRQFTDFFVVMSFSFSEDPHMSLQVVYNHSNDCSE